MSVFLLLGLMRYSIIMKKAHAFVVSSIIIVIAILLFSIKDRQKPQELRQGPIVAIGDSLVYGYGASVENDFVSILSQSINQPIINLGIVRETTFDIKNRLTQDVVARAPALTIVLVGGNDFLRRIPKADTLQNIEEIVTTLKQSGSEVLLLGVSTMVYSKEYQRIAIENGAQFVPAVLDGVIGVSSLMSDPVHPNDAGYAKVAEKILPTLQKIIKKE